MDTFLATHWTQLQTTLWFYSRSRLIVRLAAQSRPRPHDLHGDPDDPAGFGDDPDLIAEVVMPGGRIRRRWLSRTRTDLSFEDVEEQVLDALRRGRLRAAARKNGQGSREPIPEGEWPGLRFYWDKPLPEMSYLPPAVRCSRHYVGPCTRQSPLDVPYWTDLLFEREEVLALRPDPIRELLRTTTEPTTLAEGVALLVRERSASKEVWARLRRTHGGGFSRVIEQRIDDAGSELLGMLRKGELQARGRFCDRDRGTEVNDRQVIAAELLDEAIWVDPCSDGIWTEPNLPDGRLSPIDRGYRDVLLKPGPFSEGIGAQSKLAHSETDPTPQASRSAVYAWYRDEWVPQFQSACTIPTRQQEEEAARQRFGPGHRGLVRDARKKHAPLEWTKTGPKQLNRKARSEATPSSGT